MSNSLFLGFDLSTQQLKIISTYSNLKHHKTYKVDFDKEFSEKYHIKKGVQSDEATGEIYTPVQVWIDAVQLCFDRMKADNFPFEKVKALSGSCQQHGSVYWSKDAPRLLSDLSKSEKPMLDTLFPDAFTFKIAPNWQDHSTAEEISLFEKVVGGADKLSQITGSRAHYRFTGPQIRKMAVRKDPELYKETYRISLVSSFLGSLICGKIVALEEADACGMNLYDLQHNDYDNKLLSLAAGTCPEVDACDDEMASRGIAELRKKLGQVHPIGYKSIGTVSEYFVRKYGFSPDCKVYSFTGDNLATILALPLANNDLLVSMGTSTTVLLVTDNYKPSPNYHIFKHPTNADQYMGMLCYCNGALAREHIRNEINQKYDKKKGDWTKFDGILDKAKPMNGKLEVGIYFPIGEIIPNAKPCERRFKFDLGNKEVLEISKDDSQWTVEEDVAAIIESQALSCRLRVGPMIANTENFSGEELSDLHSSDYKQSKMLKGRHDLDVLKKLTDRYGDIKSDGSYQHPLALVSKPNKVFFVGGSSQNLSIVRKYCSILGAQQGNFRIDLSDACALGGCYKSLWSYSVEKEGFKTVHSYDKWLAENYNWDDYVDQVDKYNDLWDEYVDGVGILSVAEQRLEQ